MRLHLAFTVLVCCLTGAASFAPVSRVLCSDTNPATLTKNRGPSLIVLGPYSNKPTPEWAVQELEVRSEYANLDIRKTQYASIVKAPKDAYFALAEKGQSNALLAKHDIFLQAVLGGAYVGIGCLLSLVVAGNCGGIAAQNPGLIKLIFAALFPVNLILVLTTGAQLFSGNSATAPSAYFEGLIDKRDVGRSLAMSLLGNIVGCGLMAWAAWYTGFLSGGVKTLLHSLALTKAGGAYSIGQVFVKAVLCNWMVALAVFLGAASNDMSGKIMAIWFPIFTFVAIGLEHSVANLFLLPAALLTKAPLTLGQVIFRNLIPVCLGNFVAGSVIVAAAFSYQFGKLIGNNNRTLLQKRLDKKEAEKKKKAAAAANGSD
eukprot:scaffold1048_cov90-Amphora_coffeaeformis.AAC.21